MHNPMGLENKTILITGASEGIGKTTAVLASKLGAKVIMIARSGDKLESVLDLLEGKEHRWRSFDLKEIAGIETLIADLVNENGPFDGLVHCAGIAQMRPLKMTTYFILHDMMLINFYSFIELTRCLIKKGSYNEGMSIVGMSSAAAIRGYKSKTAYSASKSAMDGAIRAMSKELCTKKIRINSIIAGFVRTEMYEKYKLVSGLDDGDSSFEAYCLGIAEPMDIANSIIYLLSGASKMVTGTGLLVDSGATT